MFQGNTIQRIVKTFLLFLSVYLCVSMILHHYILPETSPQIMDYPRSGDIIINKFSKEKFIFRKTSVESDGMYSQNDLYIDRSGFDPRPHVHLNQDETFQILEGELTILIEGKENTIRRGQTFTVQRGFVHQYLNLGKEEMHAIVTVNPAEKFDLMLTQFHGFFTKDEEPPNELIWFLQTIMYNTYYDTYPAKFPVLFQRALSFILSPTVRLMGLHSWYPEFSEKWRHSENR